MLSILTIGSATRDVFLLSKAFKIMPMPGSPGVMAECVTLGAKIDVDNLVLATGGGATNAAVTFARLGFAASCMARIGSDEPGDAVLKDLIANHVDTSLVSVAKKENTGYSTLLTAENGERTVLVFRGASANFSEKDVKLSKIAHNAVYLTSLGGNVALATSVAKACKQKGAMFIWNPGMQELKAGRGLDPVRKLVNILIVNLEEKSWDKKRISYEEVTLLAFGPPPPGIIITYTVEFENGPRSNPEGSLTPGKSVKVREGMVFSVTETGRS